ncbi:MAG: hypothetical protein CL927_01220 [Deltaproteobacteria bacterium]|nr:hypothetical protein [Deltaproteobacteria bacterium]
MGISTVLAALYFSLAHAAPADPVIAGPGTDAARLLSRFAAGRMPDTSAIHHALDALSQANDNDSLVLLQSIRRHEHGSVQAHALEAETRVAQSLLHALRETHLQPMPGEREVSRWVATARRAHDAAPASELRVVAYVVMLTEGSAWHSESLGGLTPEASAAMVRQAEAFELDGHFQEALPLLIDAFMSGDALATAALQDRGVDTNRLALGLSSPYAGSRGIPRLHQLPVVETTDAEAVTVLLSRAADGTALPRLAAIENLGVLLRSGQLNECMRKQAQTTLNRAVADGRPSVRRTAESALSFVP